jgi:hypothetical protein
MNKLYCYIDRNRRLYQWTIISVILSGILIGQLLTVIRGRDSLWPFTEISVYKYFPENFERGSVSFRLITPGGDIQLAMDGAVDFRIIRHFRVALYNAKSKAAGEKILKDVFEYTNAQFPEKELLGVKLLNLEWDMKQGVVLNEELLYEYRKNG